MVRQHESSSSFTPGRSSTNLTLPTHCQRHNSSTSLRWRRRQIQPTKFKRAANRATNPFPTTSSKTWRRESSIWSSRDNSPVSWETGARPRKAPGTNPARKAATKPSQPVATGQSQAAGTNSPRKVSRQGVPPPWLRQGILNVHLPSPNPPPLPLTWV